MLSWSCTTASQTSSALSRLRDVPNTESTHRTLRKKDAITSLRTVFPFCLLIRISTVRKRKRHSPLRSPMISIMWTSAHICQGYSFLRRTSVA